ncbi:CorA family divalent cation transporter [Gelidibacter salicanalis]|uniref:Magnesium transporter CorA n=1 Tax=Gelidibacter salicanalis TaxID=291193 RepID=A0A934NJ10_9FLAO|nr:CorA family divalent cation transporter [Gelidibacter salicanalis]MBJ7880724.1 hypothetical protein [Gelidibacter salicanalis]
MSRTTKTFSNFTWTDLKNPTQDELKSLDQPFNLDFNLLEDSLQHGHLPKIEKINDYTFIILRAYTSEAMKNATTVEELSNKIAFFINDNNLLTIHRADFDFLKNVPDTYHSSQALMLKIIDNMLLTYKHPLEIQSSKMDEFEKEIFLKNGLKLSIESLYYQKSEARISKKLLQLTQNVLNNISVATELDTTISDIKDTALNYLLQYEETIEEANSILNTYLSITAHKSSDVMKLLTVFSAFFLPLTFIAGIYGMNFDIMPELRWQNGYFITLGVMVFVALVIYVWFKLKKIF